ncbi:radical SAM protein [Desulfovibrio sp. OttesenSCG-928-M16]|nr:radical SAM protein [Desulfovibrio sp. OttesenSCG-928-M16]
MNLDRFGILHGERILQIHAVDHCNNNCKDCNHYSLYAPQKEYSAEDYFSALDILYERCWYPRYLVIIGGEPFLHPDLSGFVEKISNRYPFASLSITSNGFWISEENLKRCERIFQRLSRFIITVYPNMHKRINEAIPICDIKPLVCSMYPHLEVKVRDLVKRNKFYQANFDSKLDEGEYPQCGETRCSSLLPNGNLSRCSTIAYATASNKKFRFLLDYPDVFFNVFTWPEDFVQWLNRIPFDACARCPFAQPLTSFWSMDAAVPFNYDREREALNRLKLLPVTAQTQG